MIDQNSQFMAILTAVGEAKQANAAALGIPWTFSQMGVGDANGTDPIPDRKQTQLIHEQRRAPLNQVRIDPKNSNLIIAEQVIPENVGGWWIREIGLYDEDADLVAVANCAPSFKPLLAQGSGKTQVVRMNFIVTSAANVVLKIDPSVVLATRQYVDERIIEVLPPTRIAGVYQQVRVNERGVVVEGANPDTLAGHGITNAYTIQDMDRMLRTKPVGDSITVVGLLNGNEDVPYLLADATKTRVVLALKSVVDKKANQADTLAGYGIATANQSEAEVGTNNTKAMTPQRVAQAIVKRIRQATESSFGWAKIATQTMVNEGVDDTAYITPKKVRNGILFSFLPNGYFFLPTWMGGLGIQWGIVPSLLSGTALIQSLPIAFPNSSLWCGAGGSDASTGQAFACNAVPMSQTTIRLAQAYGVSIGVRYWAIGF